MAFKLADGIQDTSTSPSSGTGVSTVTGTAPNGGFKTFSSYLSVGDTTWLTRRMGNNFETGIFTYTNTNELTPTTIFESSNGNAAVSWTAGTKVLFCDLPASKARKVYSFEDTTEATGAGTTAGALFAGGVEVAKKLFVSGNATFSSTTASSSSTSGALVVAGGAGIAGALYVGANLTMSGTQFAAVHASDGTFLTTGKANLGTGVTVRSMDSTYSTYRQMEFIASQYYFNANGNVGTGGSLAIGSTSATTSSTSGALTVAGGVGVSGDMIWGGAAPTSYTPLLSAGGGGSFSSASASGIYKKFGKLVVYNVILNIGSSGVGSATGYIQFTTPTVVGYYCSGQGEDNFQDGYQVKTRFNGTASGGGSVVQVVRYDNSGTCLNNHNYTISGFYFES